jgi:predicted DCC family thiol-disulfide oxidoreductase YuxK
MPWWHRGDFVTASLASHLFFRLYRKQHRNATLNAVLEFAFHDINPAIMTKVSDNEPTARCTVYYDGACPICRREIGYYQSRAEAGDVRFVDAATCEASLLGPELDRAAALKRMHIRTADGSLISGAAAFAELWQRVPGWRLAGKIAALRPVVVILEGAYRLTLIVRPRLQRFF